ncbi:hypothetical protein GCM10010840_31130 [Deinococcus aerolatus]|uniref:Uncharacterized protein n=1 Tax=Deinococcus aerolatus TaxID=522487 RepID=A0ABQ2GFF9_9DEIO|nr:hypothetical protein [Deinococcus aerolatus]GGL90867.1 hypothetical protein GCM10010840_31130 [Deinococcus aerolatus]
MSKQLALLPVTLTRLIQDGTCPDWIEAELTDADDRKWVFTEKVPVVGVEDVEHLPDPLNMFCLVLEEKLRRAGEVLKLITFHEETYVVSEANRYALTSWVSASDLSDVRQEAQK